MWPDLKNCPPSLRAWHSYNPSSLRCKPLMINSETFQLKEKNRPIVLFCNLFFMTSVVWQYFFSNLICFDDFELAAGVAYAYILYDLAPNSNCSTVKKKWTLKTFCWLNQLKELLSVLRKEDFLRCEKKGNFLFRERRFLQNNNGLQRKIKLRKARFCTA